MNLPKPPKTMTRRHFLKTSLFAGAGLFGSGGLLTGYSYNVEPKWIESKQIKLSFKRLPDAFHGKRVVQFSDVHIGHHFDLANLQHVVDKINETKPDALCFTGDLFDSWVSENPVRTGEILGKLEAPLGKWAVLGNHDYYTGVQETINILQKGGFTALVNRVQKMTVGHSFIYMAGVDDIWEGKPDLVLTLKGTDQDRFTLLLSHSANYADIAAKYPIDLQLSGHSHGGQVRLPMVGAITTPPFGDKYVMGHYKIERSSLQVYTNRGIGTSVHPVRFLCRPEITVITLEQQKN